MNRGNIRPAFGVLGPSLPGLKEGSLYAYVKDLTCLILEFDFRLVIWIRVCFFVCLVR